MDNQVNSNGPAVEQLVEVRPPRPGGIRVLVPHGRYLNFDHPGEAVEGYLLARVTIKNQRGEDRSRYLMMRLNGHQVLLPDHVDLSQKLGNVLDNTGPGARLYIAYRGREKVPGYSSLMARYEVFEYPTSPEEQTRVAETIASIPAEFREGQV